MLADVTAIGLCVPPGVSQLQQQAVVVLDPLRVFEAGEHVLVWQHRCSTWLMCIDTSRRRFDTRLPGSKTVT